MLKIGKTKLKNILLFLIIIASGSAFLKLSEEILSKESIVGIDQAVANWIYTLRSPFLNDVMKVITSLGSVWAVLGILVVLAFVLYFLKKEKYIIPVVISLITSIGFSTVVKILLARPRPIIDNALVIETSYSFPSGHTLIAITFYGILVIYLCMYVKSNVAKVFSILFGILIILAVGFSRIYLGVHWPSDVLASLLLGIGWLAFIMLVLEYKSRIMKLLNSVFVKGI